MKKTRGDNYRKRLVSDMFGETDRKLSQLSLLQTISQEELDLSLEGWDIESAPIQTVMLASFIMKNHPELVFPEKYIPRLKGVLTFCRFQYLKLVSHVTRVMKTLEQKQIVALVIKGGAMKAYRPDFPRWMSDIDIVVAEKDYQKAFNLIKHLGYKPLHRPHSIDMRIPGTEDGVIDIHRYIKTGTGDTTALNEVLFSRAKPCRMFSSECLVPCREDMVFISLVNYFSNILFKASPENMATVFLDIMHLVNTEDGFDWEIVKEDARKTGSVERLYIIGNLSDDIAPGVLPARFLEEDANMDVVSALYRRIDYNRNVLAPLRKQIVTPNIMKSIKTYRPLWKYFWLRCKLFFLKRRKI